MLWILRVMLVLLPGLALAQDLRPAEEPPADFFARQYIDSKGCVFLRDEGGGWQPRVSRDGTPICGYPPTLSARGLDGKPRLRALDPNAGRSRAELLEEALSQTVITQVRPGELASDPQPMEKLPDLGPEPMASGPAEDLRAAVAAAPSVRQGMGGGLKPNLRLCELLGYDGKVGPARLGSDPSQGYCDSLPDADLSRLSFMRPIGSGTDPALSPAATAQTEATAAAPPASGKQVEKKASPPAVEAAAKPMDASPSKSDRITAKPAKTRDQASPASARTAQADAKDPVAKGADAPAKSAVATVANTPKTQTPGSAGMIPAGARYVQLGTFGNPGNADRAMQRVAALGYPVLRGKDRVGGREMQVIMAGPFTDRESIVRALDAIRRAGFRDAFAR
ncbi:Cell division protein FtsN [Paracoccus aminovorans]|uniref:Cell division protein FtsN n=1 Tax=Paracoccus aminovorans TaxID=34004 RepID=A0A1I2X500_9RHOB|nr:SPOR domain-containing protein [Paracoccus aminovorans]CQR85465.1 sporulation domain-containing protein [Paracoccus aminovorans]SFH07776.1 Cell division protein FtsN [Paracoccus aminovorans]